MAGAPRPSTEQARLASLSALGILDTLPEERFDRITRIAQRMFHVPLALVSFVDRDRQWFKSHQGTDLTETPREVSLCAYAILEPDQLVVGNAREDCRFVDNPFVTPPDGIRFYAGSVIRSPDGQPIGTLCISDTEPREISDEDMELLHDLARVIEREIGTLELATVDELTGLLNRAGFLAVARQTMQVADRTREALYFAFYDVDGLKRINDGYGHTEGDRALVSVGAVLKASSRESDVLGRLGGDEFCAIVRTASQADVLLVIARLEEEIRRRNATEPLGQHIGLSKGWTRYEPGSAVSVMDTIDRADKAMYSEKQLRRRSSSGHATKVVQ